MEDRKVKQFELNSDYFVIKAVAHEMDGDIIPALASVKRALTIQDDVYLRLKCAAYYELMEMYELANNIYFDLLVEKGDIMHCYYALSDNMFCLLDEAAALHYLDKYTRLAQSDEAREEASALISAHMTEQRRKNFSLVPDWAYQVKSETVLAEAVAAMEDNKPEEAAQLFGSVPKGSIDYIYAKNNEALCLIYSKNLEGAALCSLEVLRLEPENYSALASLVKIYASGGKYAQAEVFLDKLKKTDPQDPGEMRKLCFALCSCRKHEDAARTMQAYLETQPYDLEIRHLLGIALYNLKQYANSARCFEEIIAVSDMYRIEKYYKHIAVAKRDGERGVERFPASLQYRRQLPDKEIEARLKRMKLFINRMTELNAAQTWKESGFKEVLYWAFSLEDSELNYFLIRDLAVFDCKSKDGFFNELLINCFVPESVKRHIVYYQAVSGGKNRLFCTFANVLKEIKLNKNVDELPIIFRAAYGMAVATLASLTVKFERTLSRVLNTAAKRYALSGREFKKTNALAAALVFGMDLGGKFSDMRYLAELFSCKTDTLSGYIKTLEL